MVALLVIARSSFGQTIPNANTMGPALAGNVHGSYTSAPGLGSPTTVNAPVVGNGDMALIIGGQATSLTFDVGKADFWGVEHGVIMPVGSLVLSASALSGSSYSLVQNVGPATVTGRFTTGNYGLGLNAWVSTSENTAFIQLTNTGSQSLTFTSQLRDGYGTTGNPGTLGYSTNSTWLKVSPDAVYLELGNHMNIGTNAPLQGRIADMQIFGQALSSAQLNALETPSAVSCLLQWATTNTGTASLRGTASLNASDPHGGSVVLTGDASSEVAVGVMGMPQTKFTVSAWVYLSAFSSSTESCIFAGLVNHGVSGYPFMRGLKLVVLPNGALSAALNTSGSAGTGQWDGFAKDAVNAYSATASGALPLNQWIQTAVTYDGYALTIYTNGTAVGVTTNFPSAAQVAGYNKMAIHLGDTNSPFKGCAPQGVLMQSVFGVPVTDNGNTLTFTLPAGGQATIALAAVTDRNTNSFMAAAQQQSQGANATSMNSLYQSHNQWWSNFWSKSFVQISDQLVQSEWYASLYLLACSSRSNCPPPGLWGNYITSTGMYWEGDYTLDYNVQATFWCALACNHPELTDNYDLLLLDHISRGQAIAQHWGYQGIYIYTHLIPFPGWSDDGYTFWSQKSGALFAAVNCAMRWRYTLDTNYAARVYPYIKGVSDFWDNYLALSNNRYVDNTDAAAESGYTTDANPATTLAFIQLVYPALIQMSQVLNVDASRRAKWSDIVARLTPLTIVSANSISSLAALTNYVTSGMNVIRDTSSGTDFPTPMVALYQDHQARGSSAGMNSTQTIFPGWEIGLESDSTTLAAASNTVYLAAEWYDDNDCSTFYPSAAAIGYDPSQILANLDAAITYHSYPNFMFAFGGGGTENYSIVPCALSYMFLQSYQTNLHIFPNWPANQNAAFGNLNACGGFLVASAMTNGLIPYVQITSTAGQQLRLLNPWPGQTFQIVSTANPTTQFSGSTFTYQTQVGEVLTLTPVPTPAPSAPVGLAVAAGIERAALTWTAGSNAMSYYVKRATVQGGPYTTVAILRTTGYTDTGLNGGTTYYYVVSALNLSGESANSAELSATPTANVPYPWMAQDIGAVGVAGSEGFTNGMFTVTASGDDIWNAADACRFFYIPVTGDCTMVARVTAVQNINSWSKAGVMIRNSLDAGAANSYIAVTPGFGVTWQFRSSDGANSSNNNTTGLSAPYWVKLVRSGSTFSGYRSPDGTNWTQQGTSQTLTMGSTVYVGLAVTAHNNTSLCVATFDNVSGPGWPPPPGPGGLVIAAVSSSQINLTWNAFTNAASYNVKHSTTNGGPYAVVATNVTATSFLDSGLAGGTLYYYVLSAVVGGNETPNSAQAWAATVSPTLGSLVHRYSFTDPSGTMVADSVGGPVWNGTLPNGGTLSGSQLMVSSASQQYASLPAGIVNSLSNLTIIAWVNLNTSSNWCRIFDFGKNTTTNMFLTPQNGSSSTVRFAITTNGGANEQQINCSSTLTTGAWHQVAVTLSEGTGILYVDGVAAGTNSGMTLKPSSLGSTVSNYIGKSQYPDPYLNGALEEFRIYNVGLSSAEIAAAATLGPSQLLSTDSPALNGAISETNVVLSWPLANAGFALQSRSNLISGNWVNVTSVVPKIVGNEWQIVLPQPIATGSTFYRLLK